MSDAEPKVPSLAGQRRSVRRADDARAALDASLHSELAAICWYGAELFLLACLVHVLFDEPRIKAMMTVVSLTTAVVLVLVSLALARKALPVGWANPVGAAVALLVAPNALVHMVAADDLRQTTSLALVLIAAGFFLLSLQWFLAVVFVLVSSWLLLVWRMHVEPGDLRHFAFVLLSSIVVALLVHRHRIRSVRQIERLRAADRRNQDRLQTLVDELGREVDERKVFEASLRRSEAKTRAILDAMPDLIHRVDMEGRILRDALRSPVDGKVDLPGPSLEEAAPPQIVEEIRRRIQAAGEGATAPPLEYECPGRSGQVVYEARVVRVDVNEALLILRDVSDRRRAVEQLRYQARLLDEVQEAVVGFDDRYRITYWNRATELMSGWRQQEVLGKRIGDVLKIRFEAGGWSDARDLAFETGGWTGEVMVKSRNGRELTVEASLSTIQDSSGRIIGSVVVTRDVTERKRAELAEAELRRSEARFKNYFELPLVGMAVLRPDGTWLEVNDKMCQTLGRTRESLIGESWKAATHPEDEDREAAVFNEVLAGGRDDYSLEKRFVQPSGRIVYANVSVKCARTADDAVDYLVALIDDVTQRKIDEQKRDQLERQLQHAQRLESLGVLAGGVAHDFNNILTSILATASLLIDEVDSRSPLRELAESIEASARRAADLTQQMLAYAGKGRFVIQPVDLSQLVHDMAHLLESSVSRKAELRYAFAPRLPMIEADPQQLRQATMNLVLNAAEALGGRNGVVTIRTGVVEMDADALSRTCVGDPLPEGEYVFLEVIDDGLGMDEETAARIFDPFFTTKFTGRGLGLAAVLGIVRGHRGAVAVQSAVGKGTTIRVLFPRTEASAPAGEIRGPSASHAATTVLVVDDEEPVRKIATRILEKYKFQVLCAVDGQDALEVFRARADEIDVVLLDLTMPRLTGEEAFGEMRKIRPNVAVVVTSGYSEQEVAQRFNGQNLSGFIQKPYRPAELVETIRACLARSTT